MHERSLSSLILHLVALLIVLIMAPSCRMDTAQDALLDARDIVSHYNVEYSVRLYLATVLNRGMER